MNVRRALVTFESMCCLHVTLLSNIRLDHPVICICYEVPRYTGAML
jgi:hypothetical protein